MNDTARRMVNRFDDQLTEMERADDRVVREFARAIRDLAGEEDTP